MSRRRTPVPPPPGTRWVIKLSGIQSVLYEIKLVEDRPDPELGGFWRTTFVQAYFNREQSIRRVSKRLARLHLAKLVAAERIDRMRLGL